MADREKILRFFKAGGDEELAGKLIDLADQARRNRRYMVSDFMDPHGINVADIVASNYTQITMKSFGGFQNAERMRIAYVVDDFYGEPDFAIAALLVTWDKRYYDVGHRDVLGAFTGMGCSRDILGDIVFTDEGAQMVVDKTMVPFYPFQLDTDRGGHGRSKGNSPNGAQGKGAACQGHFRHRFSPSAGCCRGGWLWRFPFPHGRGNQGAECARQLAGRQKSFPACQGRGCDFL